MVKYNFNPFTGTFDQLLLLDNPLQFKGEINSASDFPTSSEVKNGWFYTIGTDVTDNDPSKTNTGQSFEQYDEIAWNGTNWTIVGINGDDNYLKLDGSNVNSNIDIGSYNFTTTGTGTFGELITQGYIKHEGDEDTYIYFIPDQFSFVAGGTPMFTCREQGATSFIRFYENIDLQDNDLATTGNITAGNLNIANWDTAYTHSQDNSQAHSDYLVNNGDDTTTGVLTAAGFTTTGIINSGQHIIDITNTEALLVRKNGDSGDIFYVDTNTPSKCWF